MTELIAELYFDKKHETYSRFISVDDDCKCREPKDLSTDVAREIVFPEPIGDVKNSNHRVDNINWDVDNFDVLEDSCRVRVEVRKEVIQNRHCFSLLKVSCAQCVDIVDVCVHLSAGNNSVFQIKKIIF